MIAYLVSDRWVIQPDRPNRLHTVLPYLAAVCLVFAVPLVGGILRLTFYSTLILSWCWGILLFLAAELLRGRSASWLAAYRLPLTIASLALVLFSGSAALLHGLEEEVDSEIVTSVVFFAAAALLYLASALRRFCTLVWSAGLGLALLAYAAACFLPAIQRLEIFTGLLFAIPATVCGLLGSFLLQRQRAQNQWWLPPVHRGWILRRPRIPAQPRAGAC